MLGPGEEALAGPGGEVGPPQSPLFLDVAETAAARGLVLQLRGAEKLLRAAAAAALNETGVAGSASALKLHSPSAPEGGLHPKWAAALEEALLLQSQERAAQHPKAAAAEASRRRLSAALSSARAFLQSEEGAAVLSGQRMALHDVREGRRSSRMPLQPFSQLLHAEAVYLSAWLARSSVQRLLVSGEQLLAPSLAGAAASAQGLVQGMAPAVFELESSWSFEAVRFFSSLGWW